MTLRRRASIYLTVVVTAFSLLSAVTFSSAEADPAPLGAPLPPGQVTAADQPAPKPVTQDPGKPTDLRNVDAAKIKAEVTARLNAPTGTSTPLPPRLAAAHAAVVHTRRDEQTTTSYQTTPPRTPAVAHPKTSTDGYGATYTLLNFPSPTYRDPGYQSVKLVNQSTFTWTPSRVFLGLHIYTVNADNSLSLYSFRASFTTLPRNVAPNETITMQGVVPQLGAGTYQWYWDLEDSSVPDDGTVDYDFFTRHGVPQSTGTRYVLPHLAPTAELSGPGYGETVDVNPPALRATVYNDGTKPVSIQFQVCDADNPDTGAVCQSSGFRNVPGIAPKQFITSVSWTPAKINWGRVYYWRIQVQDSGATPGPWSDVQPFIAEVNIGNGASYGTDPSGLDAVGVNTYAGNLVRHETDLTVPGAGVPLALSRTYNSSNSKTGVFGQGWSSMLDMRMAYDPVNLQIRITFADGSISGYGRNPDGSWSDGYATGGSVRIIESNIFRMRDGTKYTFGSLGWPTRVSQNDGSYLDIVPDGNGRPKQITAYPSGRTIYLGWNTTGQIERTGTTSSGFGVGGLPWFYSYASSAPYYLNSVGNPSQHSTGYQYLAWEGGSNPNRALTDIYAPNSANHEQIVYLRGRVWQVLFPSETSGQLDKWVYDLADPSAASDERIVKVVHVADPNGVQTWFQFDRGGLLWRKTIGSATSRPDNTHSWSYRYDGKVSGEVDEDGNPTDYYWGPYGIETVNRYRDSNTIISTTRQYRSAAPSDPIDGLPDYDSDANQHATHYDYNTLGLIHAIRSAPTQAAPAGAQTVTTYTCDNGTAAPPAADNSAKKQPCNLIATVTDPDGRVVQNQYNANGDLASSLSPTGVQTNFVYDRNGRVSSKTVTTAPSTVPVETDYTWTGTGKPDTQTDPAVTNPLTGTVHQLRTSYVYDDDENVIEQDRTDIGGVAATRDPKRVTTYGYDARDRRTSTSEKVNASLQRLTSTTYDGLGAPTTQTTALGLKYQMGYLNNRLTEVKLLGYTGASYDPVAARDVIVAGQAWSNAGLLAFSRDAMGHYRTNGYTGDGKLQQQVATAYTDPDSGQTADVVLHKYGYDLAGNLTSVTTGQGAAAQVVAMTYDATNRRLTNTVDPSGVNRTTTMVLDPAGLPLETRAPGVSILRFGYGGLGNQLQSQSAALDTGTVTTGFTYDGAGRLTAVTLPGNATTSTEYDALGRPSAVASPAVNVENGVTTTITSVSPTSTTGYNTFGEITDVRDANGRVIHKIYDQAGDLVEADYPSYTAPGTTAAITAADKYTYDSAGNVVSHTDRANATTNYSYDQLGRIDQLTFPAATSGAARGTLRYRYDDGGHILSAIDPTGAQTLYSYDGLGRTRTRTQVVRRPGLPSVQDTTTFSYDLAGNLVKQSSGRNLVTTTYNGAGDRKTVTDNDHGTTTYDYDGAGRVAKVTDNLGRQQTFGYDKLGRTTATELLDAQNNSLAKTKFALDGRGNVTDVTDALNAVWHTDYDAEDRITALTDPVPSTADNIALSAPVTSFGYDAVGNQTRTTDANGRIVRQSYNSWDLPETQVWPRTASYSSDSDRQTVLTYDQAGRLVNSVEPGGVAVTTSYDALGGVLTQTGSGGDAAATASFGYDLDERLTAVKTPSGTSAVTYDDRGNVLTTSGGGTGESSYVYDDAGRLSTQTDASGTKTYGYIPQHQQPAAIGDSLTGATQQLLYYPDGQLKQSRTVATDTSAPISTRNLTYSPAGLVASDNTFDSAGNLAVGLQYTWNAVGNLASSATTGSIVSPRTDSYRYDADGRLIRDYNAAASNGTDYAWDSAGNRTGLTGWTGTEASHTVASSTSATFDQRNELTSTTDPSGTTTYAYTARATLDSTTTTPASGPTTSSDQAFDAFDRIVQNGTNTYTYDSIDRLVTASGRINRYAGLDNEPVYEGGWLTSRDASGTLLAAVNPSNGNGGTTVSNAHGDVLAALSTASGTVKSSRSYDVFGQTTATRGAAAPIGYQGSFTDTGTGLVSAQSRMYRPSTGTFLSADKAAGSPLTAAEANKFSYGFDNPTSTRDPGGAWPAWLSSAVDWTTGELDAASEALFGDSFESVLTSLLAETEGILVDAAGDLAVVGEVVGTTAELAGEVGGIAACFASLVCGLIAGAAVVIIAGTIYYISQRGDGGIDPGSDGAGDGGGAEGGDGSGGPAGTRTAVRHLADRANPPADDVKPWVVNTTSYTWTSAPWQVPGQTYTSGSYIYQIIDHFQIVITYNVTDWSNGSRDTVPASVKLNHWQTFIPRPILDPNDFLLAPGWTSDWVSKFNNQKPENAPGAVDTDTGGGALPAGAAESAPATDGGGNIGNPPNLPPAANSDCEPEKYDSSGGDHSAVSKQTRGQRGAIESHHIIQNAAVRELLNYARGLAPAIVLGGPSNSVGTPHYRATQVQNEAGGGTYGAEREIAYRALRAAGLSQSDALAEIQRADEYFYGKLCIDEDTVTRIPGTRPNS